MSPDATILIVAGRDAIVPAFVNIFSELYLAAVSERGSFNFCLSGGSTPKMIYRRLAELAVDWRKVYFFIGDERCVASDRAESNFRMANETMFVPLEILPEQVFRWRTELNSPDDIASDYEMRLNEFFAGPPRFDLCMLGLGADAHTASLFPGTSALGEKAKTCVANWVAELQAFRLTLTPPAINNSREILFVASGIDKAAGVAAVFGDQYLPDRFPAQLISPDDGRVRWLLDAPAANMLR